MDTSVAIVVEPAFGARLIELSQRMPVWVCDTPINRAAVDQCLQSGHPPPDITIFRVGDEDSHESMLLSVVGDVDLHHGEYSKEYPWTDLHVYGAALTSEVRDVLSEYGIHTFSDAPSGFWCTRGARGAV